MKPSKIIGSVATPIARVLNLDCVDPVTNQLRPESNCVKRGARIDQWSESIYNYFVHPENRKQGEKMKYRVQLIMIVDAENTLSAMDQFRPLVGEITGFNIGPVPTPVVQPTGAAATSALTQLNKGGK